MAIELIWITPDTEKLIGYMARVSNPKATPDDDSTKLVAYLLNHKHWSPFEMASMCVEINTTRDIGRQILRHRSFHFQEFSQRYAEVLDEPVFREVRLQDNKNRQNSTTTDDEELALHWTELQRLAVRATRASYEEALKCGIAKEVARSLLPEGLTPTRMYMSGTIRDWIHYIDIRTGPETQAEHRAVATDIARVLDAQVPSLVTACQQAGLFKSFVRN